MSSLIGPLLSRCRVAAGAAVGLVTALLMTRRWAIQSMKVLNDYPRLVISIALIALTALLVTAVALIIKHYYSGPDHALDLLTFGIAGSLALGACEIYVTEFHHWLELLTPRERVESYKAWLESVINASRLRMTVLASEEMDRRHLQDLVDFKDRVRDEKRFCVRLLSVAHASDSRESRRVMDAIRFDVVLIRRRGQAKKAFIVFPRLGSVTSVDGPEYPLSGVYVVALTQKRFIDTIDEVLTYACNDNYSKPITWPAPTPTAASAI